MPVKVKDFVIQASFDGGQAAEQTGASETPGTAPEPVNKNEIIDECIERVLRILQEQKER